MCVALPDRACRAAPSSACRHLLPEGRRDLWHHPHSPSKASGMRNVATNLFSPVGRRWRQPDEGATVAVESRTSISTPQLAATARQPWVRAVAVKAIADARAGWQVGWEWKWIDKSMGRRAREPKFNFRNVDLPLDKLAVVRAAASDTSPIVRRAALTALIQHWHGSCEAEELASTLSTDRSPSVRERAAFILSRSTKPAIPRDAESV